MYYKKKSYAWHHILLHIFWHFCNFPWEPDLQHSLSTSTALSIRISLSNYRFQSKHESLRGIFYKLRVPKLPFKSLYSGQASTRVGGRFNSFRQKKVNRLANTVNSFHGASEQHFKRLRAFCEIWIKSLTLLLPGFWLDFLLSVAIWIPRARLINRGNSFIDENQRTGHIKSAILKFTRLC